MHCNYGFRWELSHYPLEIPKDCVLVVTYTITQLLDAIGSPNISLACTLFVKSFARGICIMIDTHCRP